MNNKTFRAKVYFTNIVESASSEQIRLRSVRRNSSHPPVSRQEILSSRILGRIRYILDQLKSNSVVIPTMLGDVHISLSSLEKEYRVALLWPHKKGKLSHDYKLCESTLIKADHGTTLIIDGLVSAALKTVQTRNCRQNSRWSFVS